MGEHRIDFPQPVSGGHRDELRRRVYFVSEAITDFRLVTSGDDVVAVVVNADDDADADELGRKLQFMVANDVSPQLPAEPQVLWRSSGQRRCRADAFEAMSADGVVYEVAPGQVALGRPALAAMDAIDRMVLEIINSEWDAVEYRYPTLLPLQALQRSGYVAAFPQHLMFATRLHGDLSVYRSMAGADEREDIGSYVLERCNPIEQCLPTTMCYHAFHQFADQRLDRQSMVVTARGASFRHESRYHRTLERLADFTIRETVFFGSADFVHHARDGFQKRMTGLVEELGLSGRCEVATDPFFAAVDGANRVSAQRLLDLKHELHLDVDDEHSIAVSSFNLHYRHFGESFGIQDSDGETINSACVGVGLERFTFAFLCQYGWDVDKWPEQVRRWCV